MKKKYLYGKKQFLSGIVAGVVSPRFSDLSHYSRLENEKMRDDEMYKRFFIDKDSTTIKINDHIIAPSSLAGDPLLTLPTQHCYCLCLTSRGNDAELFKTFQADICLEIDVEALIEVMEDVYLRNLQGAVVDAREVMYYELKDRPQTTDSRELVFMKPAVFSHEAEFRIAMFYPKEKTGFLSTTGQTIPFVSPGESMHLTFEHPDSPLGKRFILNTFEP